MARAFSPAEKPERTADKAQRKHNLKRVGGLFRAHRRRLGGLLGLIFFSAGLGMISPFLLRAVLDDAIPNRDTVLLTALVAVVCVIDREQGGAGNLQAEGLELRSVFTMGDLLGAR